MHRFIIENLSNIVWALTIAGSAGMKMATDAGENLNLK